MHIPSIENQFSGGRVVSYISDLHQKLETERYIQTFKRHNNLSVETTIVGVQDV